MRSREVSVSIILQNLAQLKALFEKQWESIVGNCDTFLFLGGNEQSTHKYVSELLGKATIDTNTYGKSTGRNGNYSKNYQISGRELYTPDEIRMLDNRFALLFIRGERAVQDEKYNLLRHPNISMTTDGGAQPYFHGQASKAMALSDVLLTGEYDDFEVLSEEEINEKIIKQEGLTK
jgi:type IV secretion system protein VirD4